MLKVKQLNLRWQFALTKMQFLLDLMPLLPKLKIAHNEKQTPNAKTEVVQEMPIGIPNVKTKSNGKGVIMISTAVGVNDGAWIVHTVPGFPAAKTGYSWPAAEIAKGHLLICMTIAETQINAIAASLFRAEPFVYYNDIPETETAGMPDFKKLAEGQIPTMPPFTISRSIKLTGAGAVSVQIFSKSAKSRYEMYRKVILRGLKKTIKTLDYPQLLRNAGTLLYCAINDSPLIIYYVKYSYRAAQLLKLCIITLKNVVGPHDNVKFLAYNNVPPAVPNVKTKSNSKGVIIISTSPGQNDGANPNQRTASLIQIEPFVYYNDIPETETAGMPDFKKLAEGQIPTTPPFTTRRSIKTAAPAPVDIHIYSKSAKSKYELYKKVIVKALKKTMKADESNWIVSEPEIYFASWISHIQKIK
ncbi:Deoxyribonuclease-2-alpha [Trichinella spiralis]|uniref:Deoxyribonuclease-2-alpha n=1 Tax=Trichinella spiralis TaxID=6334 RepID=A0ABR3KII9_TRISP